MRGAPFEPEAIEALLCDADGCLFPSEEPAFAASAEVTNAFLAAIGVEDRFDGEQRRRATTGKNFRATAGALAADAGVALQPATLERWVERERLCVTAHLGRTLVPDPAIGEPLGRLLAGRRAAVVSSSALARVETCLRATDLARFFPPPDRFSAEDSLPRPSSKPDPAIYRLAVEHLAVEPQRGLAIEDSLPGAQAAIGAGLTTVGMLAFVPAGERLQRQRELVAAGVAVVVSSWSQLERLLAVPAAAAV